MEQDKHQNIDELIRHLAEEDKDKGGSKTTAADRRAIEKMQKDGTNFYAIDVETNGFNHNEPIQIASVLYKNGQVADHHNQYFRSEHRCTKEALAIHKLSRDKLKQLNAKRWNRLSSNGLINFLNLHEDFPIVAFHAGYDRDKVLKPAFKKLGLDDMEKMDARWICAQDMCKRTRDWKVLGLDDALEHFGFVARRDIDSHDALVDARLAAQVYMAASMLTPLK